MKILLAITITILITSLSLAQENQPIPQYKKFNNDKYKYSVGGRISYFKQENGTIKFFNSGSTLSILDFVLIPDSGMYKKVSGYIVYSRKNEKYFIRTRDEKIYPDKIKAIVLKNYLGNEIVAERSPNGDAWLFPVLQGDIVAYSAYTENQSPSITHFQKLGEEPIYKIKTGSIKEKRASVNLLKQFVFEYNLSLGELETNGDVHKRCFRAIVLYNHRNEEKK